MKISKTQLRKIKLQERVAADYREIIQFRLPNAPSVNKSNKLGVNGLYNSPGYKTYKNVAARYLSGLKAVHGNFKIAILAEKPEKHQPDLDNLIKPLLDVLQDYGVIQNDKHCQSLTIDWIGQGNFCDVYITKLEA